MTTVALVLHGARPTAIELAKRAAAWLHDRGHDVVAAPGDAGATGIPVWDTAPGGATVGLSIGGDGTMLRAVDLLAPHGVPVLGVNVGRLGYLTEVEPDAVDAALERVLAGDYALDDRMTLSVRLDGGDAACALNEAVIEKVSPGHTVRLAVTVNGRFFTTYAADGLIVATPTGSTAYSLSARGPIVSPRHRALLLTPVAPHMLFDRTLVLDPDDEIRLDVLEGPPAVLSVDGRTVAELRGGESVACAAGRRDARLVSFGGRDFHQILKAKFGLADR